MLELSPYYYPGYIHFANSLSYRIIPFPLCTFWASNSIEAPDLSAANERSVRVPKGQRYMML